MLLNWCCTLNIFNAEKSVGGDVKKSITSSLFNRITFYLAVRCRTFQEIMGQSLKLKFQTVAEKTAKNFRGLLYFAAPGILDIFTNVTVYYVTVEMISVSLVSLYLLLTLPITGFHVMLSLQLKVFTCP